jgi:hypothetical protein
MNLDFLRISIDSLRGWLWFMKRETCFIVYVSIIDLIWFLLLDCIALTSVIWDISWRSLLSLHLNTSSTWLLNLSNLGFFLVNYLYITHQKSLKCFFHNIFIVWISPWFDSFLTCYPLCYLIRMLLIYWQLNNHRFFM